MSEVSRERFVSAIDGDVDAMVFAVNSCALVGSSWEVSTGELLQ